MDEIAKEQLYELFKELGVEAYYMNHYDLAEAVPNTTAQMWKDFLLNPDISSFIESEVTIINRTEINKMTRNANKSKSVGQAQMINTLAKLQETKQKKEGPIFIYTYVPLNDNQEYAKDVKKLDTDIFLKEETKERKIPEIKEPEVPVQRSTSNLSILEQIELKRKETTLEEEVK